LRRDYDGPTLRDQIWNPSTTLPADSINVQLAQRFFTDDRDERAQLRVGQHPIALQMTASDHAQQRSQRFPLPRGGRPQMESG
jgi:hypothetical protein